jgi:hypothetical protein
MSTLPFVVMRWNFGYRLRHDSIFHKNLSGWILIHVRRVRKSFYLLRSDKHGKSANFCVFLTVSNFLDERISDHFTRHFISPKQCTVTLNIF